MSTRPRPVSLAVLVGGLVLLGTAHPAHAQYARLAYGLQFQFVPNFQFNPFMPAYPQRLVYVGIASSGYSPYGDAYTFAYTGYYRHAGVRYSSIEPIPPISSGFGNSSKVAAEQRAAIAQAQRNAAWDKGATLNAPEFDRWMKDAATRRELPPQADKVPPPMELAIDPALVNPPDEAILSGDALNRLAARIRELEKMGKKATPGLLAPELTTKIVFAGAPAADAANVYRVSELKYPLTLQTAQFEGLRKDLDKAYAAVAKAASAGKKTNPAEVDTLLKTIARASDSSRQSVADAPLGEACDVCEFYNTLESATRYLKDDKSAGVGGKEWAVTGATVAEVVQHQVKYGLQFGPARKGDEAAYFSLHRGLLAYCAGLAQAK